MEILTAKTAGFCFGVKRAVDFVYGETKSGEKPIYTFGPIIHNKEVVKEMEEMGVSVLPEEVPSEGNGTVIIRSHGVSREVYEGLERAGYKVCDATCPFVKKIHRIVSEKSAEGYNILIAGDPVHPEVKGIIGWSRGPVMAISEPDDIDRIPEDFLRKTCLVAQTTFNYNKFQLFVAKLQKKGYDISVYNSICNATKERQAEARQLSSQTDCMIVVGDVGSSNTQKLFEICKSECPNTHLVQTADDLDVSWLAGAKRVGITAGASTPHKIIEEVQTKCQI